MDEKQRKGIAAALGRVPQGLFILTAAHEERRTGMLVSLVQQASFEPAMISVAVGKGRPIMPLISESRRFALCQIARNDRVLLRKFAAGVDEGVDPFLGMELLPSSSNHLPLLNHSLSYLECELVCHMDIEGDHDVFVGRVQAGAFLGGEPHIHTRENGLKY